MVKYQNLKMVLLLEPEYSCIKQKGIIRVAAYVSSHHTAKQSERQLQ
jgi:hypothetical protein